MKKVSLLLLLAAALLTACPAAPTANNSNTPNANGGTYDNANANATPTKGIEPLIPGRTDKDRTVVLIVYYDATTNQPRILAAPDKLVLNKTKGNKLRFVVINNLKVKLARVVVSFKTIDPTEDGDLEIKDIEPGGIEVGKLRNLKGAAAAGAYQYRVNAEATGLTIPELDPEIIVSVGGDGD